MEDKRPMTVEEAERVHLRGPGGEDPHLDPGFIPSHREDDGAHFLR